MESECVIDYHNAVLYPQDLIYFRDGNWLNDNCINFVFRWFEHSLHPTSLTTVSETEDLSSTSSDSSMKSLLTTSSSSPITNQLLFLDPSVVSHIRCQILDSDDISDLHRGLKLSSRSHLFIPCNDQASFTSSSTHWSLLVIDLLGRQVYTLDSMSPSNSKTMAVTAKIICQDILSWETMPAVITSIHCPQQTNSYDCGVYVLLYALHIVQLLLSFLPQQQQAQSPSPLLIQQSVSSITPQDCFEYRTQILTAILPEALQQVKKLQRKR